VPAGLAVHAGLAVPRGKAAGIQGVQELAVTAAGLDRRAAGHDRQAAGHDRTCVRFEKFFYTVASCLDASNLSLASFDNNKAAGDRFGAASLLLSRASSVKQKQRDMQPSLYLFHT